VDTLTPHKYGKLPPKPGGPSFGCYSALAMAPEAALAPSPTSSIGATGSSAAWPMDGNDVVGDCTFAALAHLWQAQSIAAGASPIVLASDVILAGYSALTGYDPATGANDNGAQCQDVLEYGRTTGLGGFKLNAWARVSQGEPEHVRQAIYYFGGAYIGMQVTVEAERLFALGQPWDSDWLSPVLGLHCVPIIGYDSDWLYCITWGQVQPMSWRFFARRCDEAYAVVDSEFLTGRGVTPAGFDLATLIADLNQLTN
jgi:hypothetical protein